MKNKLRKVFPRASGIANALDLPLGTISNVPFFEVVSNREVSMENYNSIMEYDDNLIKIDAHKLIISFWGKKLSLKCITEDSLVIKGHISSIEFDIKGA